MSDNPNRVRGAAMPHTVITQHADGTTQLDYWVAAWEAHYPGYTLDDHIAAHVLRGAKEI